VVVEQLQLVEMVTQEVIMEQVALEQQLKLQEVQWLIPAVVAEVELM
jgi:hypothetical protein